MRKFHKCVDQYNGNYQLKSYSCLDQFLCMAFARLTYRESLRDIGACLRSVKEKLCHLGIRGNIARSTIADADENRDRRICADFCNILISQARILYAKDDSGAESDQTAYALDSATIDLCLSLFPWATFRRTEAAIRMHTLSDLRGNIPSFIGITDGKVHDVNIPDIPVPEPGSFYITDRGYPDFERLYFLTQMLSFFVTRAERNTKTYRICSRTVDKSVGLKYDRTVMLSNPSSLKSYPDKLRQIRYYDADTCNMFIFLTDNFLLPAFTIAELYRCRRQVELFFKRIRQHLRIRSFYGTSENAVRTQIRIAISTYVLVAIVKKQLNPDITLYTILQILSITLFEKVPLIQLFTNYHYKDNVNKEIALSNQLSLLDY